MAAPLDNPLRNFGTRRAFTAHVAVRGLRGHVDGAGKIGGSQVFGFKVTGDVHSPERHHNGDILSSANVTGLACSHYRRFGDPVFMGYLTRIRELREQRGMSMRALGDLCGTTAQQIERLEKDQRGVDIEWLRRLARGLQVSPADLLTDPDNPYRLRTETERALLTILRDMDAAHRERLLSYATLLLRAQRGELTEAETMADPEDMLGRRLRDRHRDAGSDRKLAVEPEDAE